MNRRNAFQFKAGNSIFHRLDPMSKLVWLFGVSLLAFGAYIAWIQIVITLNAVFSGTALFLARLSPSEVVRGTWIFIAASVRLLHRSSRCLCRDTQSPSTSSLSRSMRRAQITRSPRRYAFMRSFCHRWCSCARPIPRDLAIALVTQMHMPLSHRLHVLHRSAHRSDDRGGDTDHPLRPCGSRRGPPTFDRGSHRRDQTLCDAAAGRQPASRLDDGDVDGGARVRRLPYPHLRGVAANERVRRVALHLHGRRRRRVVFCADAGLRSFGLYFFARVISRIPRRSSACPAPSR